MVIFPCISLVVVMVELTVSGRNPWHLEHLRSFGFSLTSVTVSEIVPENLDVLMGDED